MQSPGSSGKVFRFPPLLAPENRNVCRTADENPVGIFEKKDGRKSSFYRSHSVRKFSLMLHGFLCDRMLENFPKLAEDVLTQALSCCRRRVRLKGSHERGYTSGRVRVWWSLLEARPQYLVSGAYRHQPPISQTLLASIVSNFP